MCLYVRYKVFLINVVLTGFPGVKSFKRVEIVLRLLLTTATFDFIGYNSIEY